MASVNANGIVVVERKYCALTKPLAILATRPILNKKLPGWIARYRERKPLKRKTAVMLREGKQKKRICYIYDMVLHVSSRTRLVSQVASISMLNQ